jgi:hypothetical protein
MLRVHQLHTFRHRVRLPDRYSHDAFTVYCQVKGDRNSYRSLCNSGAATVIDNEELHYIRLVRIDFCANAVAKAAVFCRITAVGEGDMRTWLPLFTNYPAVN